MIVLTNKFQFLRFFSFLLLVTFTACGTDPEEITEETFVYLVTQEGGTLVESLTITERSDGTGTMTAPEFVGSSAEGYELVIDRVDDSRANLTATPIEGTPTPVEVMGAGFFTLDSVFVQFTLVGFDNNVIFSGTR